MHLKGSMGNSKAIPKNERHNLFFFSLRERETDDVAISMGYSLPTNLGLYGAQCS